MKKLLTLLVAVLAIAIAVVLVLAMFQPTAFHVERSASIKAPPEKVYAAVADLTRWPEWSPWEKLDPAMTRTFGGTSGAPGSFYGWVGNSDVGEGRMEVMALEAPKQVTIQLDFIEPWEARSTVGFKLEAAGDTTNVIWSMDGNNNFLCKVLCVFMDMDAMIGKDYEAGLVNLKSLAEK